MFKIILSVLITLFLNFGLQKMAVEANCCCCCPCCCRCCCCPQPPIIIQPPPALHKICQVPCCCCKPCCCCCCGGGGGRRRRSLISAINRRQQSKTSAIPRVKSEEKNSRGCSMCPPVPKQLTNSTISGGGNCTHHVPKEIKNIHKQKKQIKKDN
uniref:Uncharacterized protein n=1 Tax=Meloidogyne enterolobii TaxID=390850 RepID=A0A6V7TR21_MELEN|nr:unnamed protein product [Meloidogyne enterolobii]